MLVGCSSRPIGPANGNNNIVDETTLSYQEFYDQMFEEHNGSERAAKELILRLAKDVVSNSETFKAYGVDKLVQERKNKVMDSFYTSTYKKHGYFDEKLLADDLKSQGYDIKDPTGDKKAYVETYDNLLGYDKLSSKLGYDYTDYLNKTAEYDIYVQLLKEEYILTQKESYFKDKRIRKVQYFKFNGDTQIEIENMRQDIEDAIDDSLTNNKGVISEEEFKRLAEKEFQPSIEKSLLDKAAKDYAIINDKAKDDMDEFEKKYSGDFKLDKYLSGNENLEEKDKLNEKQRDEVKSAYNNYTNNGLYTKEYGYELKKIDAKNNIGYGEGYLTSDDNSTTVINSEVDTLIKKPKLEDHIINHTVKGDDGKDTEVATNLLDATGAGSKVFKKDDGYYVVRVEEINENTKDAKDKIAGAAALTKNTTNVKNAVAYYLDQEQYKVNIHEETLYNYLKDTFGFDKEKK